MLAGECLPFQRHAILMLQVVEVVSHLHSVGVAHTDLKMENIMRVRGDTDAVQVIDYGMAAVIADRARGTIAPRDFLCAARPPQLPGTLLL